MSQIVNEVTITEGTTYSSEVVLGPNKSLVEFGLDCVGDAVLTVTLWVPVIPGKESATTDTGWKQLSTSHGWDGFPDGDPAGADFADVISVANIGARKMRFKIVWTSGESLVNLAANVKQTY